MTEWKYRKIDLNQLPRKTDEIYALCDAGEERWELVAILANNVAYLKRRSAKMCQRQQHAMAQRGMPTPTVRPRCEDMR